MGGVKVTGLADRVTPLDLLGVVNRWTLSERVEKRGRSVVAI